MRFRVFIRRLNTSTSDDIYPLHRLADYMGRLGDAKIFRGSTNCGDICRCRLWRDLAT